MLVVSLLLIVTQLVVLGFIFYLILTYFLMWLVINTSLFSINFQTFKLIFNKFFKILIIVKNILFIQLILHSPIFTLVQSMNFLFNRHFNKKCKTPPCKTLGDYNKVTIQLMNKIIQMFIMLVSRMV
jgi:hypothetical protein